MGQRHQIFIHTINPYYIIKDSKEKIHTKEKKEKLKEMFGTKKTTVFAFHNQWLYGRSPLVSALNILEFNTFQENETPKDRLTRSYDCSIKNPFCFLGMQEQIEYSSYEKLENLISCILNLDRLGLTREKGWLGSFLLNKEEPNMRDYFDNGDNNDGITIIDTIANKYCFMNINDYSISEELNFCVSDLPSYKPMSGKDYVEAYYPTKIKIAKQKFIEQNFTFNETKFKTELSKTKKDNNVLIKRINKFEVLSESELKQIFPKQYMELKERELAK